MSDESQIKPERFLFVIWEKARKREAKLLEVISSHFKVMRKYEVVWKRSCFTANLAAFYGWKNWFCWWNKARKCGRGPFLVVEVEDLMPKWERGRDTSGHDLVLNANIQDVKRKLRAVDGHSNHIHASLTKEETAHELAALASTRDNGRIPFKAMEYCDHNGEISSSLSISLPDGNGDKTISYTAVELDKLLSTGALERIGIGSRRACYRLPDGKYCLKCYRSDAEIEEGKYPGVPGTKPLAASVISEIHRYRFNERSNTCCQEYRYWLSLGKHLPADLMAAFPTMMKQVLLPFRGWAIIEELVVNADGTPVRKFAEEWATVEAAERPVLFSAFKLLSEDLICHVVRFYDPQNILVQRLAGGAFRLRITDFEPASRLLVPIDANPAIARLKVRRRFTRYLVNNGISSACEHSLPRRLRRKWDEIIATEGAKLGLANCRSFLENKIVNDIFYEGTFNGRPCIVKCSSKAPDSIANEYEMLKRVHAETPEVFPEPFALWTSGDGRMAFAAMEKIGGGSASNPAADILRIAETLRNTGIVHRDVSVCNLLFGADGHLKLIDFQFAIDRNNYRESLFMRRNPKYLYVHIGSCESLGLGRWNDILGFGLIACMEHFAPGDIAAREKLLQMVNEMTFAAPVGRCAKFRIGLYYLSLRIQSLFSHKSSLKWRLYKVRRLRGLKCCETDSSREPVSFSFCISDNYAQHLSVVIASLLVNNPCTSFVFHVIHRNLKPETEQRIKRLETMYRNHRIVFHKIDATAFDAFPIPKTLAHITQEMYYRYMLPDLLKDEKRTIYSDVDVLCVDSGIRDLWNMDMAGCPIAAIRKTQGSDKHYIAHMERMGVPVGSTYFFSGMLLMDLDALRSERFNEKCISKTVEKASELIFPDMDVINAVMQGRIAGINPEWNMTERFSFFRRGVKIWHFVCQTQKPWCNLWKNVTWIPYLKYLLKTPYRSNALKFVWGHIKGFFYFKYTKNLSTRHLVCGLRVWKHRESA